MADGGWMGLGWCRHGSMAVGGQPWCGQGGLEVEAIHTKNYLVLPEFLLFPHSLSLFPDCHLGLAWKHLTLASVPWIPWILSQCTDRYLVALRNPHVRTVFVSLLSCLF